MMGDAVRSKPFLGLMGNISAIMATLAAFGLAMYCGIEFIGINLAAPFLMIGMFGISILFHKTVLLIHKSTPQASASMTPL